MSELPAGLEPAPEVIPRDSASAIVVRPGPEGREVLLGVRSRRSRFMPGHWAFPGGAVDEADGLGDAEAFVRCAVRELAEETDLELAAENLLEAGQRTTPPMFPVRFHTAFFLAEIEAGHPDPTPRGDEIERLVFERPSDVLARWGAGDCAVPPPVLPLLRGLEECIDETLERIAETLIAINAQEQRAPRIEFAPDLWMLPVRTLTMPPATTTNVWMPGGGRFVVIDPGSTDMEEQARLLEVIARRRALGHEPVAVLLTHEHQDHVSGAAALCDALDLPLRAHPAALSAPLVAGVERRESLEDGEPIDLDGLTLQTRYTPGHSRGHVAYETVDRGGLIAGDLISGISTILVEPQGGSMGDYLDSLERMHATRYRTLFPGHGPPLPGKAFETLIRHRRDREAALLEQFGDGPAELGSIARGAYRELPQLPQALIEMQALAHLIDLERRGAVRRGGDDRTWERT
ncbi:MAG: MBL fold metallo-hydrolase [Acidobacteria bacterium]|nr:MBL fold metallo-hydrolase [Acidobacteriota bacterium]NIM60188.1 MBL fold metallo-hydrolase [Acidobacteriota bacterium]NIO57857.1 MBL fold metallo-hydrolase [Acidobacteriota bacterium]NIQ28866.1 MBL fold metallo-hydrolase [Acidobacteriota bacterium]NIQ83324.1 MBL fold metallo-hydrolase [Acidobacteriota bacterium]